ncbi:MAG: ion transporter [Paludibacteraceae bacterium]|nr:ion transporter [Paludibacteraceae bacterium]
MNWRQRIFEMIEVSKDSLVSKVYDWLMLVCIIVSLVPLGFREQTDALLYMDLISVSAFIIDYLLRWMTADLKFPNKPKWKAFLLYPVTAFAIIDLLSILPSFITFSRAFKLFRVTRLLKILRVFKFIRYFDNIKILFKVLYKERHILFTVFLIALSYIVITALIMFNIEQSDLFENFFDALYWATTTLTTVGYGDIYPGTDLGRMISMLSAILGVAIIALPSGVITASYLEELREQKQSDQQEDKSEESKE